ncbi:ABC transporter substrate-binding protein [Streptomyces sp. NPDC003691]
MKPLRSRPVRVIAAAAVVGSLALTGCSNNDGKTADESKSKKDAAAQSKPVQYADAAGSTGPAPEVPGAKPGGFINVYMQSNISHMDPGQIYVSDAGQLSNLIHRGLTNWKEDASGNLTVVGDLATDAGKMSDGGKTWTYTLKDNIKDGNGNPITSADIRHTFERLYAKFIFDGPTYIQNWLSGDKYRDALPDGPYTGKSLPDTVLATPDAKTIVFKFQTPQGDLPQALAMPGYSIVPKKGDTKEKYDKAPVALGPYKIAEYKSGKSLKLVKNPHWDAKTDSVRHAYPDGFNFNLTVDQASQTKRLIADQGEAKNAIQFTDSVDPTMIKDVISNSAVKARSVMGYQPYVWQMTFNLDSQVVKDKKVRDAITHAIPTKQMIAADGGNYGGELAGGLMGPTLPGYDPNYDPYGKGKKPAGDLEKGKKLLEEAGVKKGTKLTYAYSNSPRGQKQMVIIKDTLGKLGFDVQAKEIDRATFYEQIGKVKNPYDLYMTGWGQDWPSPSTVITPVYDGTKISDGGSNYSHINDPQVNEGIKKALALPPTEAAKEWEKVHHRIVEEINPAGPVYYAKHIQLSGSNIGGLRYDTEASYIDINNLFLKNS